MSTGAKKVGAPKRRRQVRETKEVALIWQAGEWEGESVGNE